MRKLKSILASLTICLVFTVFASTSSLEPITKPLPITNVELLKCCSGSFSGDFKYDNDGWKVEVGFKITFGIMSPGGNNSGEEDNINYSIEDDLLDILLGGNSTHENYLILSVPKKLVGTTIDVRESNIKFRNPSCGGPLLNFINLKVASGKIVLKEKTYFKLINVNPVYKKPRKRITKSTMKKSQKVIRRR